MGVFCCCFYLFVVIRQQCMFVAMCFKKCLLPFLSPSVSILKVLRFTKITEDSGYYSTFGNLQLSGQGEQRGTWCGIKLRFQKL